jgi:5'-phosphate synthase pdxT subunit
VVDGLRGGPFPGVFIRAPRIESAGARVEVLATHDDVPVLARQGAVVVTSFHPELSGDLRLHELFLHGESERA